jgi:uncharacterized protein (DUF433 family)
MTVALDTLLVRSPGVCGGKLRIDGTRITVLQVASLYRQGMTAEGIGEQYPHLALAQVYAALAYYHANRVEVDAELAAEAEEADRLEALYAESNRPQP